MTLRTSIIIGTIIATLLGSSRIATASSEEYEDVCGPNYFQNKDGECNPDNECKKNWAIITVFSYTYKNYYDDNEGSAQDLLLRTWCD